MESSRLDSLGVFVAVAEARGFSAAAIKLGTSPSAVSQAIRALEARLGVALFARTTRSVRLTDAGERFFLRIKPALAELSEASAELSSGASKPAGSLRINVSRAAYSFVLRPVLQRFLSAYPDVELEVSVDSALVDIVKLGFDAGMRYDDMVEHDMVSVRVGPPLAAYVVASPEYLARRGAPQKPAELLEHDCILYRYVTSGRTNRWLFQKGNKRVQLLPKGRLVLNDDAGMVEAALAGVGIAYLTSGYVERHVERGRLVRLLAAWSPPMPSLSLYYPSRRGLPPKLRALIDFLRQAERSPAPGLSRNFRPGRRRKASALR